MSKKLAFLWGVCVGIGLLLLVGFAQRPQTGDATPADLRPGYRELYMDLVARAYAADPSLDLQMALGEGWTPELSQTTLQALLDKASAPAQWRILRLATALEVQLTPLQSPLSTPVSPTPTSTFSPVPYSREQATKSAFKSMMVFLFVVALLIGAVVLIRRSKRFPSSAAPEYVREYKHVVAPTSWEGESTLPMLQFTSTYTLGDDRYDPSRSIETPKGQFLGECGVGIVSASKQGQSRLAPAFEVWIFDKNDTHTQTHVLLSEYAAQDEEVRPRLAKENPSSLVKPGMTISLQTATLQLRAKVIETTYLPHDQRSHCYFERLALEIAVWQTKP